ncbi:MAG: hypothetical protein HN348_25850, partial [Proteobacteria bacterium]|nr:hypothetical protein [Pseudomonadota bacterium]
LEAEIQRVRDQSSETEAQLQRVRDELQSMHAAAEAGGDVTLSDRSRLMSLNREARNLQSQLGDLESNIARANGEIDSNNTTIRHAEDNQNTRDAVTDSQNDPTTTRARDATPEELSADRRTLEDAPQNRRRLEEIDTRLQESQVEVAAKRSDLETARQELADMEASLGGQQGEGRGAGVPEAHLGSARNRVQELEADIARIEGERTNLTTERTDVQPNVTRADDLEANGDTVDSIRAAQTHQTGEGYVAQSGFEDGNYAAWANILRTPSSARALGGVGSGYKTLPSSALFEDILSLADGLTITENENETTEPTETSAEPQATISAAPADGQAQPNAWGAGSSDDFLTGNQPENEEDQPWYRDLTAAYNGAGTAASNGVYSLIGGPYSNLLDAAAPPATSMEGMEEHYEASETAAAASVEAWASALDSEACEEVASLEVADEEALNATDGEVVQQAAEQMGPVGEQLQATEEDRQAQAEGAETESGEADGEGSGMTGQIVSKLGGDGGDYVDDMDPETAQGAGDTCSDGQGVANEGGAAAKEAGNEASSQNAEIISEGQAVQAETVTEVSTQRSELEATIQHDQSNVDAIQEMKAGYMQEAIDHQSTAESEAGAFNSDLDTWSTWAGTYRSQRGGM